MMLPTARAAPGRPASSATSPYVATRPGGILRTVASTRAVKVVIPAPIRASERQPQPHADLGAAGVHLYRPIVHPQVHRRRGDPHQRSRANRAVEHPLKVDAGVEPVGGSAEPARIDAG